eukprot:11900_1
MLERTVIDSASLALHYMILMIVYHGNRLQTIRTRYPFSFLIILSFSFNQNTADYPTIVFDNSSTSTPLDHDNPMLLSSIPKYPCHLAGSLLGSTASSNPITSRKFALCFAISSSFVLTEVIRKQEDKDSSNATTITPLTFVHATRTHDTRPSRLTSHYSVSNHLFRSDKANHWKSSNLKPSDHVLQSVSLNPFTNIHSVSIIVFILFNICCILSSITFRLVSPKHAKGFMLLNICLLCTSCSALNIVAGMHHNCALSSHNTVKCWGRNSYGSLGLGDVDNRGDDVNEMGSSLPEIDLGTDFNLSTIVVGGHFTCAISFLNTIKCWGSGLSG